MRWCGAGASKSYRLMRTWRGRVVTHLCASARGGIPRASISATAFLIPSPHPPRLTCHPGPGIARSSVDKRGAVSVPRSIQFGPHALEHRLADSGARALITDGDNLAKGPRGLPDLATVLVVDGDGDGNPLFWPTLERARDAF